MDTINKTLAQAYIAMYETKEVKTERKSWVPEAIADEDVADFMGAAAAAAKAGKKEFKFGDKTYKVTMKKDTVDAISDEAEVCEKCGKVHEGSCMKESVDLQEASVTIPDGADGMSSTEKRAVANDVKKSTGARVSYKGNAIIYSGNKKQIEKALDQHFPDAEDDGEEELLTVDYWKDEGLYKESVDEAKKAKGRPLSQKQIKRALQSVKAQPKDKVSLKKAPWDESLDESPEQPRAKGEKDFKKMHDDNTEIVDEKDGEDETFDNIKKSANAIKESTISEKVDKFETMLKKIDSMPDTAFKIRGKLEPSMGLMRSGYSDAASIKVLAKNLDKFIEKSKLPKNIKDALAKEIKDLAPIAHNIDGLKV
jgi:ribosomal protein S6E (S10)